jgi:hypothetical protein
MVPELDKNLNSGKACGAMLNPKIALFLDLAATDPAFWEIWDSNITVNLEEP